MDRKILARASTLCLNDPSFDSNAFLAAPVPITHVLEAVKAELTKVGVSPETVDECINRAFDGLPKSENPKDDFSENDPYYDYLEQIDGLPHPRTCCTYEEREQAILQRKSIMEAVMNASKYCCPS